MIFSQYTGTCEVLLDYPKIGGDDIIENARTFQQVTHKGGESAINYIKIFQNAHTLSISVGNSYAENQIIHTFLDNS